MHWMARQVYTLRVIPPSQMQLMQTAAYIFYRICKTNPAHGQRASTPRLPFPSQMVTYISPKGFAKGRSSLRNVVQAGLATTRSFFYQIWGKQWQNSAWTKKTASAIGQRR